MNDAVLFDFNLEKSVLATAMSDPDAHKEVCGWSSELFGNPAAKYLHDALRKLSIRNAPADPLLVLGEIKQADRPLVQTFLSVVMSQPLVSVRNNMAGFEDRLVELARIRAMYQSAEEGLRLIKAGHKSDEIAATLEQYSNGGYSRQKGVAVGDAAVKVAERAKTLAKSGLKFAGIPTGYPDLDHHIGGLCNGHLVLLAGFTNMGKSAFAIQLCNNALKHGAQCGYISMELSASDIAERMIALSGVISTDDLRTMGGLSGGKMQELEAVAERMTTLPLTIMDRPTWSMHEVRAEARRLVRKGCNLLVIDLLGKVHVDSKKQDSRARELEMVAAHTKALAKELEIPILGCVQLNRQSVYDQQAELHHLKDSNGLAENADEVLILDRRNAKLNDCKLYVKVRKSRRGSNTADIPFKFNPKHQSFDYDPPEAL